mmetsp:Transcript_45152/g.98170  ORF Transcript_45152/g.98170 Transcript_45152/m.98170 type:complete len:223 (-) Transcript_45152:568-1236(-)
MRVLMLAWRHQACCGAMKASISCPPCAEPIQAFRGRPWRARTRSPEVPMAAWRTAQQAPMRALWCTAMWISETNATPAEVLHAVSRCSSQPTPLDLPRWWSFFTALAAAASMHAPEILVIDTMLLSTELFSCVAMPMCIGPSPKQAAAAGAQIQVAPRAVWPRTRPTMAMFVRCWTCCRRAPACTTAKTSSWRAFRGALCLPPGHPSASPAPSEALHWSLPV